MKDYADYINNILSDVLSPEQKEEFRSQILRDDKLREQYHILLSSREYLKAKADLEEIENDPEMPLAEKVVKGFYEDNEAYFKKRYRLKSLWIALISIAVLILFVILY